MNFTKIKKYKDNKWVIGTIIMSLIILMILWTTGKNSVFTDNAYLQSDITIIRPKVTGYITEVVVKDNQTVKAGDIIAKIDDRDYQLKHDLAMSDLDITNSKLKALEDSLAIQELTIDKTNYVKNAAKATFDKAQKAFDRAKALAIDRAIAQKDLDNALAAQINAKNDYESTNSDHEIALLQKSLLLKQKEQIQASLSLNQANLGLARLDLEHTIIRASVDGVISGINLQIGQLASSSVALAYLVHDNIWVIANFKETQVTDIKTGNEAILTIDSFPGKKFKGIVDSLSPASGSEFSILPPENATGNFTKIVQRIPVKIIFDTNQDLSALRTGLSTQVTIYND
jgi:membrane fusion protein (multidrug efflux system)